MLTEFSISVDGDVMLARAFETMAGETDDMTEPLRHIGDMLLDQVREQFATEGAASGEPWPPLDREYERWKAVHFPGRRLLVRTGAMEDAATTDRAVRVTRSRMTYELDSPYAHFHQRGTRRMPRRRIVELPMDWRRDVDRTFAMWLHEIRRDAFHEAA